MRIVDGIPMEYLGDAVYAKFENGMVGLTLNDHRNDTLIWLEPEVLQSLMRFHRDVMKLKPADKKGVAHETY